MDEWGVDGAITGSQKGLMLPAGLGLCCVSRKALDAQQARIGANNPLRRAFFDFDDMLKSNKDGYFPLHAVSADALWPARGPRRALRGRIGERLRAPSCTWPAAYARRSWRVGACSSAPAQPKWYSDTVSAIMVPEGFNGGDVIKRAFKRYNLALGAGLSEVAGKLFRIGHLGRPERTHVPRRDHRRRDGDARHRYRREARQWRGRGGGILPQSGFPEPGEAAAE